MWGRLRAKWKAHGGDPFTDHDLRAKAASDADDLVQAQLLMDHASAETTDRIYRRAPIVVKVSQNDLGKA